MITSGVLVAKKKVAPRVNSVPRCRVPERYSPRQLLAVADWCRKNPGGIVEVSGWAGRSMTVPQWLQWFRDRLAAKINAADPRHCDNQTVRDKIWRKTTDEYQCELARLGNHLRGRLVIHKHGHNWYLLGERVAKAVKNKIYE